MTQNTLPFTIDDFGGIDNIYVDQQRDNNGFVQAFYTPGGIRILDGRFSEEIRNFDGNKEDYKELRSRIRKNPHLHSVIIQNLVENLDRVWDEINGV